MKFTRLLAAVLAVFFLTSCQQPNPAAEPSEETSAPLQTIAKLFTPDPKVPDNAAVFLAGSDLQHSDGHETACETVQSILNAMKNVGYDRADGLFFCGDYNWNFDGSVPGLYTLRKTVQRAFRGMEMENMYFVQGNHDPTDTNGLSQNGANDRLRTDGTDDFSVYIIHEQDYMWYNTDKQTVIDAAVRLETYLTEKVESEYTRPIFILAHLPLHYSMRTYLQNDSRYANYLFDVINAAGEAGLNIFYLFGHNHSKGWDDYLGGSAIYLAKGDTINVAQSSHKIYNEETLAFTYLNAGYTGYYHNVNEGAETDLSMTVFQITDTTVTIERYTTNGLHDLKSPGVPNTYLDEPNLVAYEPDTRTYPSPQTIPLNQEITP